jgi:hypothetical protein
MLHVLGFVPECAPNYTRTGHVSDSRQDIMFSSTTTGTTLGEPSQLDVNVDDYYRRGAGPAGCLDLANSAFLDPLPAAAEPPPTWPYVDLTDLGCTVQQNPGPLGVDTGIMFVNKYLFNGTEATASIYEVVETAPGTYVRQFRANVPYNDGTMWPDFFVPGPIKENTVFVVLVNGSCVRQVRATATPSRFIIQ